MTALPWGKLSDCAARACFWTCRGRESRRNSASWRRRPQLRRWTADQNARAAWTQQIRQSNCHQQIYWACSARVFAWPGSTPTEPPNASQQTANLDLQKDSLQLDSTVEIVQFGLLVDKAEKVPKTRHAQLGCEQLRFGSNGVAMGTGCTPSLWSGWAGRTICSQEAESDRSCRLCGKSACPLRPAFSASCRSTR